MDVLETGKTLCTGIIYVENEFIKSADQDIGWLLGYQPEELLGRHVETIFQSSQEYSEFNNSCLPEIIVNGSTSVWVSLFSKHRKEIKVIVNVNLKTEGDIIKGLVLTCITDFSFQQSANREIEKLKLKNDQKDKLIAVMAHDLLGLVGGSINLIDLIELDKNNKTNSSYIESVFENIRNTHSLLKKFIDWSKVVLNMKQFTPKKIDVHTAITSTLSICKILRDQKQLNVNLKCRKGITFYTDQNKFECVIRNLLTNAIKFSKHNGNIDILVETLSDHLHLKVIDFGFGMSEKKINNLFNLDYERFKNDTKMLEGAGVGLFLVHEFIKAHHGEIHIESAIGQGTKISLDIPLLYKPQNSKQII